MKKTSRTVRLLILLTSTLILLVSAPAFGEPLKSSFHNDTDTLLTHYDTERVKFLYTTGRYMEAAVASKRILTAGNQDFPERNRVVLIKWLSDLRLGYTDLSFGFHSATFAELPELNEVFEILYRRGDHETLIKLSEGVEGPLARYFQGLALYATGNFTEAEEKLLKIPSSFDLYPHAELILSQIAITREDTDSALTHLNLAKEITQKNTHSDALKDRLALNIGYVLFNTKDFKAAEVSFTNVDRSGKLKQEAVAARAWSRVKQGDCKGTLTLIDKLRPLSEFTKSSQELMILESYCQDTLGDRAAALTSLTNAIDLFQALESSYATIYIGGHLPLGIVELLDPKEITNGDTFDTYKIEPGEKTYIKANDSSVTGDAAKDTSPPPSPSPMQSLFFLKGLKSAAITDDSNILALAEDNYRALKMISSLYRKKEREIDMLTSSLGRKVKAKREGLDFVKEHSLHIKEKLQRLSSTIYTKEGSLKELSFTPSKKKAEILRRWEKHLNRSVTELEEQVIDIVMLDGEDGVWYLNNTQYCQFLYWMAIDQTKADTSGGEPFEDELGVIEKVIRDLELTSSGVKTPYEILLPTLEPLVKERNKDDEERLKSMVILKDRIHKNRLLADAATEKIRLEIEAILVRRAGLMRFDIRSVLEKAFMLLRDIERQGAR